MGADGVIDRRLGFEVTPERHLRNLHDPTARLSFLRSWDDELADGLFGNW